MTEEDDTFHFLRVDRRRSARLSSMTRSGKQIRPPDDIEGLIDVTESKASCTRFPWKEQKKLHPPIPTRVERFVGKKSKQSTLSLNQQHPTDVQKGSQSPLQHLSEQQNKQPPMLQGKQNTGARKKVLARKPGAMRYLMSREEPSGLQNKLPQPPENVQEMKEATEPPTKKQRGQVLPRAEPSGRQTPEQQDCQPSEPVSTEEKPSNRATPTQTTEQHSTQQLPQESVHYNTSKRIRINDPLCRHPAALQATGEDLELVIGKSVPVLKEERGNIKPGDAGSENATNGKGMRRSRGRAKPREPSLPEGRPRLCVVGDYEFASSPQCNKVITTIKLLAAENMPGPFKSYTMFPVNVRLHILRLFLQRYSWWPEEDVARCLLVFENIAKDAYARELHDRRINCRKEYGDDKEKWKDHPPSWCHNIENWKGLCNVWSEEGWTKQSETNKSNKRKGGYVVHHVAGSRSTYRHRKALVLFLS